MKFGDSSLADVSGVDYVANLIKDQIWEGYCTRAVVCSAMGTNALLEAGNRALRMYTHSKAKHGPVTYLVSSLIA